jgi:hypothetical protein
MYGEKTLNTRLWVVNVVVVCILGFLAGYTISSRTGVEPGYFESAEAGGYGVAEDAGAKVEISKEQQKYYKSLTEE